MAETLRLQVQTSSGWVDILTPSRSIAVSVPESDDMEAGTLVVTILDVALDPADTDTLASGRPVRLLTLVSAGWVGLWAGKIDVAKVSYPRPNTAQQASKRAIIEMTVVDMIRTLNGKTEPRSVATLDGLRTLLAAGGVSYRINGTTAAGPASPLIVASQDDATLAQQVAITRDTVRGYAWVAGDGVLEVRDPASMPTALAATFSDAAGAAGSYSTVEVAYDSTDVLDEVSVDFLRYKPNAKSTETITYGPYRRQGATGSNSRTVTMVAATEDAAAIEAFGRAILDRNDTAQVRPLSLTTPVRTMAEREAAVLATRCALVRVKFSNRVDATVRVASVEHTMRPVNDNVPGERTRFPDGNVWLSTYTFGPPEAVQPSARLAIKAPQVLNRLAVVDETQAQTVEDLATLTTQVVELAEQVADIPAEPTAPPTASPAVTVVGLPDGLALQLLERVEFGARVQYHLSANQTAGVNFSPTAATAVGSETNAGAVLVNTLPDGTAFVDGVTYYARAVALNDVGSAAAGQGGAGALNRNAIREQFIAMLRSVLILTGRIEVGQAYIDADEGFVIPNPAPPGVEPTKTVFPFDGTPIKLVAEVIATILTVSGIATFLALVRIRRRLEVGDGISAPTEAPTGADHWPATALPALGGDVAGLVQDPTDATAWVIAVNDTATSGKTVYKVSKAGTSPEVLFTIAGTSTITGITFVADHYFVLLRNLVNGRNSVRKFTTAGVQAAVNENVGTFPHRATIGTDGTLVLLSWVAPFGTNNNALFVRTYTAAALADQDVFSIESTTSFLDLAWVGRGVFNFGATRTVIAAADNDAWVWSGTLASPTRQAAQTFKRALGVPLAGLAWDGTRFQALTSTGRVAAHSAARIADQAVTLAGSWEGRTAGGVSIETNTGTTRAVTVGAQAQLLVTVPTPPEVDLADSGKANRAAVYADVGGTRRRQAGVALGSRTTVLDTLSAAGRAAGATGTFDSSPGDLVPERGATEADKGWIAKGSGYIRLGDWERFADGTVTLGPVARAAVTGTARPAGEVTMHAGETAPTGWLICDGASVSRATYPALFAVIGTTYGTASSTTFNLPDLVRRVPVGVGGGIVLGRNEGVATQSSRTFAHTHTTATATNTQVGGSSVRANTASTGSSSFNDIPHLGLNFIIKT